jgi:hypothetical protein
MQHDQAVLAQLSAYLHTPYSDDVLVERGELAMLIRWCQLKVDQQLEDDHRRDAQRLVQTVSDHYRRAGGAICSAYDYHYYDEWRLSCALAQLNHHEDGKTDE